MRKLAFLPVFLLLFVSCTSLEWSENPYDLYSRDLYICGVGNGSTYEKASFNAKQEIASMFGTAVSQSMTREIVETSSESEDVFELRQSIVNKAEDLYGIEIVNSAKRRGQYTVLAVMPKKKTAEFYKAKLDSELSFLNGKTEEVKTLLGSLKAVEKAVELLDYCTDCNVLSASYSFLSDEAVSFINVAEYEELYEKALDAVVVEVKVTGDDTGYIKPALAKAVTEAGFTVLDGEKQATARIEAVVSFKNTKGVGNAEGFVFTYYNAELSFSDLESNEKLFVSTFNGKEGHGNVKEAKLRSVNKIVAGIDDFAVKIREKFIRNY